MPCHTVAIIFLGLTEDARVVDAFHVVSIVCILAADTSKSAAPSTHRRAAYAVVVACHGSEACVSAKGFQLPVTALA